MTFDSYDVASDWVGEQENPEAWRIEQVPMGNRVKWQAVNSARFAE